MSDIQCRVLNNEYSIFYISNCCLTSMIKLTLHNVVHQINEIILSDPVMTWQYPTVSLSEVSQIPAWLLLVIQGRVSLWNSWNSWNSVFDPGARLNGGSS